LKSSIPLGRVGASNPGGDWDRNIRRTVLREYPVWRTTARIEPSSL
jgi:hypothetical protein